MIYLINSDLFITQTRERSMTEAAFDRVSSLVGAFNLFRKKEEPTGTGTLFLPVVHFLCLFTFCNALSFFLSIMILKRCPCSNFSDVLTVSS